MSPTLTESSRPLFPHACRVARGSCPVECVRVAFFVFFVRPLAWVGMVLVAGAGWPSGRERRVPRMAVSEEPKVSTPSQAEDKSSKAEMVVVNTENTEFSAGVLGGIAGEKLKCTLVHPRY